MRDLSALNEKTSKMVLASDSNNPDLKIVNLRSLTSNKQGEVLITDFHSHPIRVYSSNQGKLLNIIGTLSDNGEPGSFLDPEGICVDQNGNIYVADSGNHRIQVMSRSGQFLRSFGSLGTDNGTFRRPMGVTVDDVRNRIYVADSRNHRVQVFDLGDHSYITTIGKGQGFEQGELENPMSIAINSKGEVVISDHGNRRIQVFSEDGEFLRSFGEELLGNPYHIAIDDGDRVFVCDCDNNEIKVFSNNGELERSFGRDILSQPVSITLDVVSKEIWVANYGRFVCAF